MTYETLADTQPEFEGLPAQQGEEFVVAAELVFVLTVLVIGLVAG